MYLPKEYTVEQIKQRLDKIVKEKRVELSEAKETLKKFKEGYYDKRKSWTGNTYYVKVIPCDISILYSSEWKKVASLSTELDYYSEKLSALKAYPNESLVRLTEEETIQILRKEGK